jgi:hypothetical protein
MKSRSAFAAVAVAIIALAVVVEAQAAAAPTTVKSFTAERQLPGFVNYSGKISSPKARCKKNRRFSIIHDGTAIASSKTDENGKFSTIGPEPPDGDKVKVVIKKKRGCKKASKSTTYDAP